MRVACRVDASTAIGTGHVMRCLALADDLTKQDGRVRFVSRALPLYLQDFITSRGHEVVRLPEAVGARPAGACVHVAWLGAAPDTDARQTRKALAGHTWDWLVVDHYGIDARWEALVRPVARRLLVIDDLADRPHDCDVLLDQNIHPAMDTRYRDKVPASSERWLGPQFLLLRDEFRRERATIAPRRGALRRVFVSFGGADALNHTAIAIAALAGTVPPETTVDVVIGAQHPDAAGILAACRAYGYVSHVQSDRMAALMARSDLAISACGFVCYELMAMLTPAILVPVTPIQAEVAQAVAGLGAAETMGLAGTLTADPLRAAWRRLADAAETRAAMSLACEGLVDAQGAPRVAGRMRALADG